MTTSKLHGALLIVRKSAWHPHFPPSATSDLFASREAIHFDIGVRARADLDTTLYKVGVVPAFGNKAKGSTHDGRLERLLQKVADGVVCMGVGSGQLQIEIG